MGMDKTCLNSAVRLTNQPSEFIDTSALLAINPATSASRSRMPSPMLLTQTINPSAVSTERIVLKTESNAGHAECHDAKQSVKVGRGGAFTIEQKRALTWKFD
jgi:hypothetical protein